VSSEIPICNFPSFIRGKSIYLLNFVPDSEERRKKKIRKWLSSVNMLIGLIMKENNHRATEKANKRSKTLTESNMYSTETTNQGKTKGHNFLPLLI